MPTTTTNGIVIPAAGTEPADLYGVATRLGNSVNDALNRPYCLLEASAATSVANTGNTKINLATTVHNDTTYFTVASSVVTFVQAGLYDLSAWCGITASIPTTRFYFSKNGTSTPFATELASDSDNNDAFHASLIAQAYTFAAGDTVQMLAEQNSAGAQSTLHTGLQIARMLIRKVG